MLRLWRGQWQTPPSPLPSLRSVGRREIPGWPAERRGLARSRRAVGEKGVWSLFSICSVLQLGITSHMGLTSPPPRGPMQLEKRGCTTLLPHKPPAPGLALSPAVSWPARDHIVQAHHSCFPLACQLIWERAHSLNPFSGQMEGRKGSLATSPAIQEGGGQCRCCWRQGFSPLAK